MTTPQPKQKTDLNERFTDLADKVSQKIGEWPITAAAILALFLWIGLGPFMHFSDTWQLVANTPTTWLELFIGFLCAAATNRAEKHLHNLLGRIEDVETQNQRMESDHGNMLSSQSDQLAQHGEMLAELKEVLTELHAHVKAAIPADSSNSAAAD